MSALRLFFLSLAAASLSWATPVVPRQNGSPVVTISAPAATFTGSSGSHDSFLGINYAQSPVGNLRLAPPQAITADMGSVQATSQGSACPQMFFSDNAGLNGLIPTAELGKLLDLPLFQTTTDQSEDCLYLNVYRPSGVDETAKLPVLFWIFGGGFELGWPSLYDGGIWVDESVSQGQPIIMVTINYRLGGFGFLGGKEIKEAGAANLGLLDQRLALQWVADNIEQFGGDPTKVTIWGESAGAISVFDQMAAFDGNNTYNGQPLFRGGIMNSGSTIAADPVDCAKAQNVYDNVVSAAGCSSASDTLGCLRQAPYETFLNAVNAAPGILSYQSVALSYLPRPDGVFLTDNPASLVQEGKYADVPFIIGDQEDEGTLFALFQSNLTTQQEVEDYLSFYFLNNATPDQVNQLVSLYSSWLDGSPFSTGLLNQWYPQFKQLAALLGDLTFTLARRGFLSNAAQVKPNVPSWSYLSTYDYGTPIIGTVHASDILQVWFGVLPDYASSAFRQYYINFVNNLDPNQGQGTSYTNWPQWSENQQLLQMSALSSSLIDDNFRQDAYNFIVQNAASLTI